MKRPSTASQVSGEYLKDHLAEVMEQVQNIWTHSGEHELDEETLLRLEREINALAEELIQPTSKPLPCTHVRGPKWFGVNETQQRKGQ